jgi:hypothetical protein
MAELVPVVDGRTSSTVTMPSGVKYVAATKA